MASDFSRTLALLRREKKISQRTAAADLGVSQALLSHYENGLREPGPVSYTHLLLFNPAHTVSLRRGTAFRPDNRLIRRILQIGVPNGLERCV